MKMLRHAGHLALVLLASCVAAPESIPGVEDATLTALVAEDWEVRGARWAGATHEDHPAGIGAEARAWQEAADRDLYARLEDLDESRLGERDRVTRAMLMWELEGRLGAFEFGAHTIPFTSDSGFHSSLAAMGDRAEVRDADSLRNYLDRLEGIPRQVEAQLANMREGLSNRSTAPRTIVRIVLDQVRQHVDCALEETGWWRPLAEIEDLELGEEREVLLERARLAAGGAQAAFADLARFLETELLPEALESLACVDRPRGRAWYEHLVRQFTTLDMSPEEVHQLGLDEVARIRAEMETYRTELEFEGSLRALFDHMRSSPEFQARTPEELLEKASRLSKRADGALPALFGRLPRNPYGVEPVPDAIAPHYTGGRYVPGSATRSGTYWVNTYALESRTLYTLPALTLHEAVPGHHLQMTLAQELTDLPPFRRSAYVTAYGEGWGLYSEWLGIEMGMYDTPYDHLGRLTYEMWRACRLVVDTGIHAFHWDRQRAIDYLADNTALSLHECTTEVDRYISWPGQALAYKIGEIELRQLRARAEEILGDGFDVRAFHDHVLAEGTLPLRILRERMEAWIEDQS